MDACALLLKYLCASRQQVMLPVVVFGLRCPVPFMPCSCHAPLYTPFPGAALSQCCPVLFMLCAFDAVLLMPCFFMPPCTRPFPVVPCLRRPAPSLQIHSSASALPGPSAGTDARCVRRPCHCHLVRAPKAFPWPGCIRGQPQFQRPACCLPVSNSCLYAMLACSSC